MQAACWLYVLVLLLSRYNFEMIFECQLQRVVGDPPAACVCSAAACQLAQAIRVVDCGPTAVVGAESVEEQRDGHDESAGAISARLGRAADLCTRPSC